MMGMIERSIFSPELVRIYASIGNRDICLDNGCHLFGGRLLSTIRLAYHEWIKYWMNGLSKFASKYSICYERVHSFRTPVCSFGLSYLPHKCMWIIFYIRAPRATGAQRPSPAGSECSCNRPGTGVSSGPLLQFSKCDFALLTNPAYVNRWLN